MKLKNVINDKIFIAPLTTLRAEKRCIINTFNPHSYCEAKKDTVFSRALLDSDILLPDGSGIVLAAKILNGKKIKKIAGEDLHQYLLEKGNAEGQRVFYLGSSENTLQLIVNRINKEFSNIKVKSYAPPFKQEFSNEETNAMIDAVNTFKSDILFVGMTAPKQEKWVYLNKDRLKSNIIASVGAVFDFYAGTTKRSGTVWIKMGLEWLPRLLKEPKRLWKRNFVSTPVFLWDILKEKLG